MRRVLVALTVAGLFLTGCTSAQIALVEAIVVAAEGLLPLIAGMPTEQASVWTAYTNGVMNISTQALANPQDPVALRQAAIDFQKLVVPDIGDPKEQALAQAVSNAIGKFIQLEIPPTPAPLKPLPIKAAAEVQGLRVRAMAVSKQLRKGGSR